MGFMRITAPVWNSSGGCLEAENLFGVESNLTLGSVLTS